MFAAILALVGKFGLGALSAYKNYQLKKLDYANQKDARVLKERLALIDAEISILTERRKLQEREMEYVSIRLGKAVIIWAVAFYICALVYNQVFMDVLDLQWKVYIVPILEKAVMMVMGYLFLRSAVSLWRR